MAGKDKKGGAKGTGTGDDPVEAAEGQSFAASQEDLQEMAVGMRDIILETNAELSQGLTDSIVGPLKEIKESQMDLTKSIKDMIVLLNEKLTPVASVATGNDANKEMSGPKGFILPHYQASSSSSQFNHPGEQRDVPVGGKLKMGAASHPGAVPGRWKEPNPLFTGASNIALFEKALPSPTAQNPVLLSKEQVIEYVQDQFGPALQKFGRPIYKKPYNEAVDRVEFPKGYKVPDFPNSPVKIPSQQ